MNMAITHVLLVCLGLGLLAKHGDAQPALTATAISVAENVASVVGSVAASGTPVTVTISSEPNDGQFAVAVSGGNSIDFTLAAGFTLDFETATSLVVVVLMVDGSSATGTGTVTITVTDVNEEFTNTIMYSCLSGTSYSAGSSLVTQAASLSSVTAAYSITAQSPNVGHLTVNSATGEISVATGKSINGAVAPIYTATLQLVSSSPAVTTSTSSLTILFGCSSSSGATTLMFGSITLLLAMLAALLQ